MSTLKVNKIDPQTGTALEIGSSGDTMTVPSGATLDISSATLTPPATMPASSGVNLTALNATQLTSGAVPAAQMPAGAVLQVTQTAYGAAFSQASSASGQTPQTISNINCSITPRDANSKVLIYTSFSFENSGNTHDCMWGFLRGSTAIGAPSTVASNYYGTMGSIMGYYDGNFTTTPDYCIMSYLDSPATANAVTYNVYLQYNSVDTWYFGRTKDGSTSNLASERQTSLMILTEIAG